VGVLRLAHVDVPTPDLDLSTAYYRFYRTQLGGADPIQHWLTIR
jgi:hypothetical protein